jgi:pimeloyl-ACP methyl ester carboxylesterase
MTKEIVVGGCRIEGKWFGPKPDRAPTLVLLHEGLGCVAMWRDFPHRLAERSGYGVFVYSRPGYGKSGPVPLPRPLSYMHDEAFDVLPQVLDQAEIGKCILVGHSDGASIAAIYTGGRQDFRVRGLVLYAPHFFVEDVSIESIAAAKVEYARGDLRERLKRYHGDNVDVAFRGWNDAWLDPGFRAWRIDDYLPHIRVPMLIVQGKDDQYGTAAQLALAERDTYCPVEAVLLDGCRHSPQVDQPDRTLTLTVEFAHRVLTVHEGLPSAAWRAD